LRRNEKASVEALRERAHSGDLDTRARAIMEYRVHVAKAALCADDAREEMSVLAEAGAILEAESGHDIYRIWVALTRKQETSPNG
jgi:hypothetical protein